MSKVLACRMCLNENIKMISIQDTHLQEVYENLANSQLITDDWRPRTVCCICHSNLAKIWKVKECALKAESILTHLLVNGIKFSQQSVTSLNGATPSTNIMEKNNDYDLDFQNNTDIYIELSATEVKNEQFVKNESIDYCTETMFQIKCEDKNSPAKRKKTSSNNHVKVRKKRKHRLVEKTIKLKPDKDIKYINSHEKPFVCDLCDKSFTQIGNLNRHKRIHTGGKPYACEVCNKTFAERVYLIVHRRIHTGEKRFSCSRCDKKFVQKCNLQRHERTHTGEKPFPCSKCHKTFTDMSQQKCHMRFHTQEKPYACDRCGMRFSNVSNLTSHMRTHTGEKPYTCTICLKSFPRSTTLKCHMLIHTGEKPFDCEKCNKKFNSSKYLKRHMKVHSGEKPFGCDICEKNFAVKKSLKKHMSIHTGEKY